MYTVTFSAAVILLAIMMGLVPASYAENLPDTIAIESMQSLYGPVTFGHAQHIKRERDCAVCHHHTNGAPAAEDRCLRCHRGGHEVKTMGCTSCHDKDPFSVAMVNSKFKNNQQFHQDKPGLKAAYHLGCIGCHSKRGGPVSCSSCHVLTGSGEALYRTGKFSPAPAKAGKSGH